MFGGADFEKVHGDYLEFEERISSLETELREVYNRYEDFINDNALSSRYHKWLSERYEHEA
tara:strand:- start:7253 stop:7435 length:183 start_codon:yes stop_codon:yes gene_type:complete